MRYGDALDRIESAGRSVTYVLEDVAGELGDLLAVDARKEQLMLEAADAVVISIARLEAALKNRMTEASTTEKGTQHADRR